METNQIKEENKIEIKEVFCRTCGKSIRDNAEICVGCGVRQSYVTKGGKTKTIAAILAFFLGAFGVHRFYLGDLKGILYLLFFWTLIPSLVAFVEFIIFLTMSDQEFDRKYNTSK